MDFLEALAPKEILEDVVIPVGQVAQAQKVTVAWMVFLEHLVIEARLVQLVSKEKEELTELMEYLEQLEHRLVNIFNNVICCINTANAFYIFQYNFFSG
jgi:hypothetical protein